MHPKDTKWMENSVDPDHSVPLETNNVDPDQIEEQSDLDLQFFRNICPNTEDSSGTLPAC